jgi:hypothetical protein
MGVRDEVGRFFAAMQGGASHEDAMMSLFADDAVYVEPFSGEVREHRGARAIRAVMRESLRAPLPEMTLEIDRLDVTAREARAEWTCRSPALPGGAGSGVNVFTFEGGKIVRLVTTLVGR